MDPALAPGSGTKPAAWDAPEATKTDRFWSPVFVPLTLDPMIVPHTFRLPTMSSASAGTVWWMPRRPWVASQVSASSPLNSVPSLNCSEQFLNPSAYLLDP